ncbi:MAG: VOC family protein [Planctomycetaceae bacterium]|nr:VOC family protein [Planctomycetaceae bacterium]
MPSDPSLSLIVLRVADIESAVEFYSAIGLAFEREKHGTGPEHFSTALGDAVFELYPASERFPVSTSRIGFAVASIDTVLASLRKMSGEVLTEPKQTQWGLRAVVADPDGHRVELIQKQQHSV